VNFKDIDGAANPAAFTAGPAPKDAEIELYEISDATDVCLGYLTDKEQQLMEGILENLSPEKCWSMEKQKLTDDEFLEVLIDARAWEKREY